MPDNRQNENSLRKKEYVRRPAVKSSTGYKGPQKPREKKIHHKASPARVAALEVTKLAREREAFAAELATTHLASYKLSDSDKAFALKLILGVASTRGTLDEIIDRNLTSPKDIKDKVRDALRISTYEIFFLEKTPHAAVDQGVELARSVTPKVAGLANAVLRKILVSKEEFPFGDPASDREALARLHAFPLWLTQLLIDDLGEESALAFLKASNEDAPLFIAVNAIKATDEEVIDAFASAGCSIKPVKLEDKNLAGCFRVFEPKILQHEIIKELFLDGKILVSDVASQMISSLALPENFPAKFLEIGAGRGTKTILLQSNAVRKYGKQMKLYSLDSHAFKGNLLAKRAEDYGVALEEVYTHDATKLSEICEPQSFDAVFIDAPCSGLGTLRRHPEIRWRLKPESIKSMAQLGYRMLQAAGPCVTLGGSLTYATCTVTKLENEQVVSTFLKSSTDSTFSTSSDQGLRRVKTQLASGASDAHFAVRMVRLS